MNTSIGYDYLLQQDDKNVRFPAADEAKVSPSHSRGKMIKNVNEQTQ